MAKYVGYYHNDDGKKEKVGVFEVRENAVIACADYKSGDRCLDSREDRIEGLKNRDFYIIGCGPRQFSIEEI